MLSSRLGDVSDQLPVSDESENDVTVRYWGSARSAAGLETERVAARTVAGVIDEIVRRRPRDRRFLDVIETCGVLVGEIPVGGREPSDVAVQAGDVVEFLPPFAGG